MRILALAYAFPPMHVQMTPVSLKPLAALAKLGIVADVVTIQNYSPILPRSEDLVEYASSIFDKVFVADTAIKCRSASLTLGEFFNLPDIMSVHNRQVLTTLLDMDLSRYAAIVTWSPFHSINHVMLELKKLRPEVKWIAQFSDPWAGNPLEQHRITNVWNSHFEGRMVASADAIVHSSRYSMEMMASRRISTDPSKFSVIGHCYDASLYGKRSPRTSEKILVRYVGTLFGHRTPDPLFRAISNLLKKRPEYATSFVVEFVGPVERGMLTSDAATLLPAGLIRHVPTVGYVESLSYMAGADLLVLIEADVKLNLFLPSKVADYIGSGIPILGLVPPGASRDVMEALGGWRADPGNIEGISQAFENALDHIRTTPDSQWCDENFRISLSGKEIALKYRSLIERVVT